MNSAMVNPMPARKPPPKMTPQLTPSGRRASLNFTASQLKRRMPTGLPTTRPSAVAMATGSRKADA